LAHLSGRAACRNWPTAYADAPQLQWLIASIHGQRIDIALGERFNTFPVTTAVRLEAQPQQISTQKATGRDERPRTRVQLICGDFDLRPDFIEDCQRHPCYRHEVQAGFLRLSN
jgi:hypothetical protein